MKIYYAHPITTYDSKQESLDLITLNALGFTVINPNSSENEELYKTQGMDLFLNLVSQCDAFCFRSFPDGSIPSGISKELNKALELKLPIIELPNSILKRSLDINQTWEYLLNVGRK